LPGDRDLRLVASSGYPDDAVATLRSTPFDTSVCADAVFENGVVSRFPSDFGTVAAIIAPIHSAERVIGYMVAGVTRDPERLAITPHLVDRIKGLAAQASISISNAILVDQIRHQAVHDALTGLPNRSLILDRTEQMLARARRSPAPVAALFIDLDGFKDINDTLGHSVGDQVLREVANRLAGAMRASDSVGRLGGDEFVVLVDGGNAATAPEMVADRLLSTLRAPFEIEGVAGPLTVTVTASIGIAIGLRPSATELLRDADIALYRAKSQGRDCLSVFLSETPDLKPGSVLRPAPSAP
jgi:diguanylate cyclase (GGDEF)-like protein